MHRRECRTVDHRGEVGDHPTADEALRDDHGMAPQRSPRGPRAEQSDRAIRFDLSVRVPLAPGDLHVIEPVIFSGISVQSSAMPTRTLAVEVSCLAIRSPDVTGGAAKGSAFPSRRRFSCLVSGSWVSPARSSGAEERPIARRGLSPDAREGPDRGVLIGSAKAVTAAHAFLRRTNESCPFGSIHNPHCFIYFRSASLARALVPRT
jgi:hypothetical protein